MTTREELHDLLDDLPDGVLDDAEAALRRLSSGQGSALRRFLDSAPLDDEPLTDDERTAIANAEAELARGEAVPHSVG